MIASPARAGELPSPKLMMVFIVGRGLLHLRLPSMSKQYRPREPKLAQTYLPSVTGE